MKKEKRYALPPTFQGTARSESKAARGRKESVEGFGKDV